MALGLAVWTRQLRAPDGERVLVTTEDGWTLTLFHFPPTGPARGGPPVLLGHGLLMNRWCWSLSPQGSLAGALAARGHDVWVPEYRGSFSALPPRRAPERDPEVGWGWRFEDHAGRDLPAIVEGVCARTGQDKVHWVGHSMGGLLGYVYAVESGGARLASLVTLGSPVRFAHVRRLVGPFGSLSQRALDRLRSLPVKLGAQLILPITLLAPELSMRTSGTAKHLNLLERCTLISVAFEDGSPALARWFLESWLQDRPLLAEAVGGKNFDRLTTPTLVLAGGADVLAPPHSVKPTFLETGPTRVAYRQFGDPTAPADREHPALGHADLISGEVAMSEVLPQLAAWLESEEPLSLPGLSLVERLPSPGGA